jgi:SAM-dependent methyltransferase
MDRVLEPMARLLLDTDFTGAERALDVGCGTGGTTIALARRLGGAGQAVGIDISAPMIEAARSHAKREGSTATFIRGDAQSYGFEPASFDRILSRFGVMFFDDPVLAFTNLRRAATGGAELRFITWRGPEENGFMTTAERAAAPLLPHIPPRLPDAPGQFAFADARRVRRILEDSDWKEVDAQAVDTACTFPESELVRYFTRFGPLGRVLHEVGDSRRTQIVETVRSAFDPYVRGADVCFTAALWLVVARAPTSP